MSCMHAGSTMDEDCKCVCVYVGCGTVYKGRPRETDGSDRRHILKTHGLPCPSRSVSTAAARRTPTQAPALRRRFHSGRRVETKQGRGRRKIPSGHSMGGEWYGFGIVVALRLRNVDVRGPVPALTGPFIFYFFFLRGKRADQRRRVKLTRCMAWGGADMGWRRAWDGGGQAPRHTRTHGERVRGCCSAARHGACVPVGLGGLAG